MLIGTSLATGGIFCYGAKTAVAGTKIRYLVPPKPGYRTVLTYLSYISGSVQHTLTLMRPIGETTLRADANDAANLVELTSDPGLLAQIRTRSGTYSRLGNNTLQANDNVIIELPDGTYLTDTVASVVAGSATLSLDVTLTSNLPTGRAKSGAKFWHMGIESDSEPADAVAQWTLKPPTSATRVYQHDDGFFAAAFVSQPLLIISDNLSAAGTLELVAGYYGAA